MANGFVIGVGLIAVRSHISSAFAIKVGKRRHRLAVGELRTAITSVHVLKVVSAKS